MRDCETLRNIEHFHLRDQQQYWFTETKENVFIKIDCVQFLEDWFGTPMWLHFLVLEHQYGRRDVMKMLYISKHCLNL